MRSFPIQVYPSKEKLPKEKQLAWALAEIASQNKIADKEAAEMVANRLIDDAAVALAAINRPPVIAAREQAKAHPRKEGGLLFGVPLERTFECEWAAWANNVAVRELDMHDTFLAADYSHPGDTIPPLLAVAQQKNKTGKDLVLGILTAYEIQMNLVKGISLHEHKKDHVAHLAPAVAGGLGTLLRLDTETLFQAINQSVHLAFSTRQSRKGEISSWKAYAPAFAGKLATESVDRAMRGEKSPSPIYEGEEGILAVMLGGKNARCVVPLPEPNEKFRAILESYTKEHSAEYQSQALIDIAFKLKGKGIETKKIREICIQTSHHTDKVIGTGSNDPQKFDPDASRETLDHSAMYIFAVALEDGFWHYEKSYSRERTHRPETVELWKKIRTEESPEWTKSYHHPDPSQKKFGARVIITMKDGKKIEERLDNANAHPCGKAPFQSPQYVEKFKRLTQEWIDDNESSRFLRLASNLILLSPKEVRELNVVLPPERLLSSEKAAKGIF